MLDACLWMKLVFFGKTQPEPITLQSIQPVMTVGLEVIQFADMQVIDHGYNATLE